MSDQRIFVANVDWAMGAASAALPDIALQIHRREHPVLRLAYIAKRRDDDPDHPWNWCRACRMEIPVRHVHRNAVQCPSCLQRFLETHEAAVANESLRASPGYAGPYHDTLSAAWHEWSLQPVGAPALPDGALAFDVTPYALPFRSVYVGHRTLSRRERRRQARQGRRGRLWNGVGSMRVAKTLDVYQREEYAPDVIRGHRAVRYDALIDGYSVPESRAEIIEYRRTRLRGSVCLCRLCGCELRLLASVYIEQEAPHLMQPLGRGLQYAARSLAVSMTREELCFCANGRSVDFAGAVSKLRAP